MSIDLDRAVTPEERAEIAADGLGTTWDDDDLTVGDVITSMAGIGYGGHFDECSDDEHDAHEIMARHSAGNDDDWDVAREVAAIHEARNRYTNRVRAAADALPLIVEALGDAIEYREPLNIGCCPDNAMCEDHASDQAKADEYTALLHALTKETTDA